MVLCTLVCRLELLLSRLLRSKLCLSVLVLLFGGFKAFHLLFKNLVDVGDSTSLVLELSCKC